MKTSLLATFVLTIAHAASVTTLANFPNSIVYAVQADATGNIYVAGLLGNFIKADPFVAKLSPTGQTLYSTTFAGSNFGIAWAIRRPLPFPLPLRERVARCERSEQRDR